MKGNILPGQGEPADYRALHERDLSLVASNGHNGQFATLRRSSSLSAYRGAVFKLAPNPSGGPSE